MPHSLAVRRDPTEPQGHRDGQSSHNTRRQTPGCHPGSRHHVATRGREAGRANDEGRDDAMSDEKTPPRGQGEQVARRVRRRAVLASMLRSVIVAVAGFVLYFTLPFDSASDFNTGVALLVGLVAVAA